MARYKGNEYSLFPRKLSNSTVWYYYAYDAEGNRLPGKSTGIGYTREKDRVKTRREAEAYCDQLIEKNALSRSSVPTLNQWVEDIHFWDWKRSKYIREILLNSPKEKPGITEGFCRSAQKVTENNILPYHGNKQIDQITPYDCKQLLFFWVEEKHVSAKTANNWKSIYRTILEFYETELKMKNPRADFFNPWKVIKPLGTLKNKTGGLTISEAQKILNPDSIDFKNNSERLYYTMTKLAFLTGMRINEICGLWTDDICDHEYPTNKGNIRLSYIEVRWQWHHTLNERTVVKDKEARQIPIAAEMREELEIYMNGPEKFLFSFHPEQNYPVEDGGLRRWFYKHMEKTTGINKEVREQRNLKFHSARRFFNTLLTQAKVDSKTIQRFTGHDSDEMTEHYTDYLPEDLQEISRAQDRFLIGSQNG